MGRGTTILTAVLLAAACASALGREPGFAEYRAVQESLHSVHPRFRTYWLKSRGYDVADFMPNYSPNSDSQGLRLVGKYGRGASVEVTGRDTLVALTLGSEVALLNFANPDSPVVLSEIQLGFMPANSELADSLLIVGGRGMEIWSIADPASPVRLSRFPIGAGDFCVRDTLVCFIQLDTFRVYSIGDPVQPRLLGLYPDSGYVLAVSGNTVIAGNPAFGLAMIDISSPATPHRVGTFQSDYPLSAMARGKLCCASFQSNVDPYPIRFVTLDISDPASVSQMAHIDSAGGYDISLSDTLAFASGRDRAYSEEFQIISIADSAHPRLISRGTTPYDNWGVWACPPRHRAYVADRGKGLSVFDISNLVQPVWDTAVMVADLAYDVAVDGNRAYVADYVGGLRVLDVSNPGNPAELGGHDSIVSTCWSVVTRDSFVFLGWRPNPYFRSVRVDDPASLDFAGTCATFDKPMAMVIRDSFAYCAERLRFQVVNVARPREPTLVGTCNIASTGTAVVIRDSLAYIAALHLTVANISRPDSPQVIYSGFREVDGLDVIDTIAYLASYGLKTASIADPTSPRLLDSVFVDDFTECVVVVDSLAYLGGRTLRVFNVADPAHIFQVGGWQPPDWVNRLHYAPPYVYAACWGAGVCILDTLTTGISEERPAGVTPVGAGLRGSIVQNELVLDLPETNGKEVMLSTYDMTGRCVEACVLRGQGQVVRYSFARLPAGVYVLRVRFSGQTQSFKVVKP